MNQAQFYFLLLLLILSQADWLTSSINSFQTLPLAVLIFYHHYQLNLMPTLLVYILALSLNTFSRQHWIGHGDLDVIALGFTLIPFTQGLNWLWLASLSQLGCHLCLPNQLHLPFLPALTFAWLVITTL